MDKQCFKCLKVKPLDEFSFRKGSSDEHNGRCKMCMSLYNKEYNKINPQKKIKNKLHPNSKTWHRKALLRQRYGLTIEQFEKILKQQGGRCAICHTDKPGSRGTWFIDHNHETKQIRGLLCLKCNTGLGYFNECTDILEAAIIYLKQPSTIYVTKIPLHDKRSSIGKKHVQFNNELPDKQLEQLYLSNYTLKQIAKLYTVAPSTILNHLRYLGTKMRKRGARTIPKEHPAETLV